MTVKILSDFGQSALEYTVDYEYNKEDNDILTVTEPESIADIKVDIAGMHAGELNIQYADTALAIDAGTADGTTPVDVLADLMYDLRTGQPSAVGTDRFNDVQTVSLCYETMDRQPEIMKKVWIQPDTMAPVYAEIYRDGQNVLTLSFEQFG